MPTLAPRLAAAIAAAALLIAGLLLSGRPADAPAAADAPVARAAAAAQPPMHHLRALARIARRHDGTRYASSPGYTASVRYVSRTLRRAGYRVRRQSVPFPFFEVQSPTLVRADGVRLRRGRDFKALTYSGSGTVTGAVRAVRFESPVSGCKRRDFARLQRGEVALVRRGTCAFADKAENAARAGAAAVLIANEGNKKAFDGTLGGPGLEVPAVALSAKAGRALIRAGEPVRVKVDAVSERRRADNVIAELPGSRQVMMAGAHLDSVPEGPGINDNGSGVAALLTIAQRRRDEPGLRFGFWAAEEQGLYGSKRYVRSLNAAARKRITAYVNLDMVGSPNPDPLVYGRGWLVPRLEQSVRSVGLTPKEIGIAGSSDHSPFIRHGILAGGIHSGADEKGSNGKPRDPCYHQRCDDLSNIDRPILRALTNAADRALG